MHDPRLYLLLAELLANFVNDIPGTFDGECSSRLERGLPAGAQPLLWGDEGPETSFAQHMHGANHMCIIRHKFRRPRPGARRNVRAP